VVFFDNSFPVRESPRPRGSSFASPTPAPQALRKKPFATLKSCAFEDNTGKARIIACGGAGRAGGSIFQKIK